MYVVFARDAVVYLGDEDQEGSVPVESLEELVRLFQDYKAQLASDPTSDIKHKKVQVSPKILTVEGTDLIDYGQVQRRISE
jgi:hypothetical protein